MPVGTLSGPVVAKVHHRQTNYYMRVTLLEPINHITAGVTSFVTDI